MTAELDPLGERLARLGAIDAPCANAPVAPVTRCETVLEAARLVRPPSVPAAHPGTAAGLLVEVSDALEADLATLDADSWATPVLFGWTVQGVVAHLTAVHDVLLARLTGRTDAPVTMLELDGATDRALAAGRGVAPEATRDLWRASVARLRHGLEVCDAPINWLGLEVSGEKAIVDRAFETWVHANDIRRATNRASLDPSGEHLKVLCDLAVELLPLALVVASRPRDAIVTVNLAGAGGGTWIMPIGAGASSGVEVVFNASARELCLLMGDRIDAADFAFTARGDARAAEIARDIVEAASVFARA
jgi:uncharacterized protein (TIGR03083 family)